MEHEGVRALLERIFKKPLDKKDSRPPPDAVNEELLLTFESSHSKKPSAASNASPSQSSRFIDFKELLKQRMKNRRLQIRREEAEEKKLDEEYHEVNDDDEASSDKPALESKKKEKPAKKSEHANSDSDESDSSDEDFKLNLDDDDGHAIANLKNRANKTKEDKISNVKGKKAKDLSDIPLTNTIPSNQLTKSSGVTNNRFNEESILSEDALFLEAQFEKKRRSLDELTNISLNLDATINNSINTTSNNLNANQSDGGLNSASKSEKDKHIDESNDSDVFDELAFLCSGQFKTVNRVREDEDEPERNSDEKGDTDKPESDQEEKKDEEEEENDEPENQQDDDDDDEKAADDSEQEKESTEDAEVKSTDPVVDEEDENINQKGFFDDEAELSGSEVGSGDEYDGEEDSNADNDSIIFKEGDEELPSEDELKDQLGKIYLKDQIDQDKKELRLIKEMYLADGEFYSKNSRRKQFRWKNLDENFRGHWNQDDSSEEDDDDDEDDQDDNTNGSSDAKKRELKNSNMFSQGWRSIRHERDQLVNSKNKPELLSDDDNEASNDNATLSFSMGFKSETSCTNRLLKRGKQLLQKKSQPESSGADDLISFGQKKRNLDGEIVCIAAHGQIGQSKITITSKNKLPVGPMSSSQVSAPESVPVVSKMNKNSILARDKAYLKSLSSHCSKNVNNFDKLGAAGGRKTTTSMMVFSTVEVNSEEVNKKSNQIDGKSLKGQTVSKSTDEKVLNGSEAKRKKFDTSESIFNHI